MQQQYMQQPYMQQPMYGQGGMNQPVMMMQPQMGAPDSIQMKNPGYPREIKGSRNPTQFHCQNCNDVKLSLVSYEIGAGTWIAVLIACCFYPCCVCLPCCIDSCKDAVHTCPSCSKEVGRIASMGWNVFVWSSLVLRYFLLEKNFMLLLCSPPLWVDLLYIRLLQSVRWIIDDLI